VNVFDPPWIRLRALVKKIAADLKRHGGPIMIPTPLIRRELKVRYGIVATHLQIWTDLSGRKWRSE
jgi:hypothetical protein